ncbi:MAG: Gfo/Idh/MocA family oxidoreductase, partial [Verrucomicrobia bacterium]|nr:Gfo/Idh/MocA family oxidoreductase [Verrucomicrobiota bacterium]
MSKLNRRNFLKTSLLGVSALAMPSWINNLHAQTPIDNPIGANSDIRVAVIGLRSRGNDHINDLLRCEGVRIVALCDVDTNILNQRAAQLDQKGIKVKKYIDMRDVFDDPEVDAVSMATPNHWHSLGTIWACQAGKDVYVEKPVSHNVNEGRRMVEAARKYERIVQTGTQCRSSVGLQEAIAWLKEGNLGKIKVARGLCYKRRDTIGN